MLLTKTDYLIYRNCSKNAWLKIHNSEGVLLITNQSLMADWSEQFDFGFGLTLAD